MFSYLSQGLKNGLRVVFVPTDSPSLAVKLLIGAGSRHDSPKLAGTAHFLEHVSAFSETVKNPKPMALVKKLDSIGAIHNAGTTREYSEYWVKSAVKDLDLALEAISQSVFHSLIGSRRIETERGAILEEYNMYQDSPSERIGDLFSQVMFGNSSLGWEMTGNRDQIKKIGRDDLLAFRQAFYQPENMILAIAGGIKKDQWPELVKTIEKYFTNLPAWKAGVKKTDFCLGKSRSLLEPRTTEQLHLIFGLPIFGINDQRRWPMLLLNAVLGGNSSSRLFAKIREDRGWAYYIGSFTNYYQETGMFAVMAGLRKDKAGLALGLIKNELLKVGKTLTQLEFKKAKSFLEGRYLLSLESPLGMASSIGQSWLSEGKIRTVEETQKRIKEISFDQVRDLAQSLFFKDAFYLSAIGPKESLSLLKND
ncbi:MAG: pitrilysin family protein [Patescibacteria group bacterium]